MLASPLPVDGRAYPAPAARALAPVAAIALVAATADPAERDFIASLAGRTVAALVVGRSDTGRAIVNIGGRQVPVNAALPAPGSAVLLSFGEAETLGAADGAMRSTARNTAQPPPGLQLALKATRELREAARSLPQSGGADGAGRGGAIVELRPQALSLGRLADSPAQPLQLGSVAAEIGRPAEWAKALGAQLRDSGAFYESHLASWTQGQYPLAQIRNEPQAATPESRPAGHESQPTLAAPPGAPAQPPRPEAALASIHPDAAPQAAAGQAATGATDANGVPDTLRAVVREQLHALETRSLPFSIDAWPGQRAHLVIAGEPEGRAGATAEPAWNTTLKLNLPRLGNIDAVLTLSGDRLWLELTALPSSADELDAASSSLSHAMQAAGVQMARVRVRDQAASTDGGAAP